MNLLLTAVVLAITIISCPVLYFTVGPVLSSLQLETLHILLTITIISAAYCFIVGELTSNNSQMDKLWSILPEVYVWIMAIKSGMNARIVLMAVLATLWGIRLTYNFALKGAYKIRFWEGEEDYRWVVLRSKPIFRPRWKWALFNLFFISIYQNLLVLIITFPALVSMGGANNLNAVDVVASVLLLTFLTIEFVADRQQWAFHQEKKRQLATGKSLSEISLPYSRGFNTTGLWNHSRHPNYLGEQGVWFSFYIFSIAAGIGIFNWSVIGALLLIALFMGSSTFGEEISSSKYSEYKSYQKAVPRFFPGRAYIKKSE